MTIASRGDIPVTLLGGYLGSGKTTLLNALLRGKHGLRLGVLVNDFGSINVDAELLEGQDGDSIRLTNGCVCCSIRDDLAAGFSRAASRVPRPDHLVVETSGVANAGRMSQYVAAIRGLRLDATIIMADAETVRERSKDKYVGETVVRQLKAADLILLSKTDSVSAAAADEARRFLRSLVPGARVVEAVSGRVPFEVLLGATPPGTAKGTLPTPVTTGETHEPHDHDEDHESTFERFDVSTEHPFDRPSLSAALRALPPAVLRLKGVVQLAEDPARRFVVQLVGKRWEIEPDSAQHERAAGSRLVGIALRGQADIPALRAILEAC